MLPGPRALPTGVVLQLLHLSYPGQSVVLLQVRRRIAKRWNTYRRLVLQAGWSRDGVLRVDPITSKHPVRVRTRQACHCCLSVTDSQSPALSHLGGALKPLTSWFRCDSRRARVNLQPIVPISRSVIRRVRVSRSCAGGAPVAESFDCLALPLSRASSLVRLQPKRRP